jgi:hydroxymethylpyrimidine pyrophosphatase-like HAD family hydrolase
MPFGIITNKHVSKKIAVEKVMQNLNVSFDNALAVGDSVSDWTYMGLAGYVGTLDNAKRELKELVKTKGNGKYTVGKSVDENGLLDILTFFQLT